jgi:hypothetical protein
LGAEVVVGVEVEVERVVVGVEVEVERVVVEGERVVFGWRLEWSGGGLSGERGGLGCCFWRGWRHLGEVWDVC